MMMETYKNTTTEKAPTMEELMQKVIIEAEKLEIKPNDRNEKGELLVSPDGPVSNLGKQSELWWKIARTESFKKWFGDWQKNPENSSKIVDGNGEPLVLFRGVETDISLKDFYDKSFYEKQKYHWGSGVFMTTRPNLTTVGSKFAGSNGSMFSAFVNIRNPQYGHEIHVIENLLKKVSRKNAKYDGKRGYLSKLGYENMYQVMANTPDQVLIIPNSKERIIESVKTNK